MKLEVQFIGHTKEGSDVVQSLEEHLKGVAELAGKFASVFGNSEWGRMLGLWHDTGKFTEEFQKYIRYNSDDGTVDKKPHKTDHSSAGAILSKELLPELFWQPLAYCISGHHAGLLNWNSDTGFTGDLQSRLKKKEILESIRTIIPKSIIGTNNLNLPCGKGIHQEHMHLWVRMLFSCLVDADHLDTEMFMNPQQAEKRGGYKTIPQLKDNFDSFIEKMIRTAPATRINRIRNYILEQCIQMGESASGLFSLNVPTGGGKTISSMAWALRHAIANKKDRIIFVIPYTSIITQTADVYRNIFGEENVIEHHSNSDDDIMTEENNLAAENWDAPIIVTTNVQFFESLFSNRPSHCRKLHNIANSIVILDEVQMLPPEFLEPIISVLKGLVKHFGVSALLCTATQPALTGRIGSGQEAFNGIPKDDIRDIIPDSKKLASELKRVRIELPEDTNKGESWDDVAEELKQHRQVLCIVNTRKDCRKLYKLMPEGTLHLSRMMCSAHIVDIIDKIKRKLSDGEEIRVISTQLVEAGVDIDFPVVYRALAGLDSIAQSAGRCNREGKLDNGKCGITKIFVPESQTPVGLLRKGADASKEIICKCEEELLSPELFKKYFELFYGKVNTFDKPGIKEKLIRDARGMEFQFATAANNFKLIDDKDTKTILVRYGEGAELIEMLKQKGPEVWLMRKLQRFGVSVHQRDFLEIQKTGCISIVHDCWIQDDAWLYHSDSGIVFNEEGIEELMII